MHHNKTEYSEYSAEEIQDLIDGLRTVVLDLVRYISILSNAPANEECNYEENSRILALLCSKVVMNQIELCLQEKNRPLLDDNTYQILSEFNHGNLIGENKAYQIISCLPSDKVLSQNLCKPQTCKREISKLRCIQSLFIVTQINYVVNRNCC